MKSITKLAVAALIASGAALTASAPAKADVGFSIGIGGPSYYGYDYYRPCRWYFHHDYPAPRRCYRDYYSYYGPSVYLYNGFVFRNRDNYNHRWRDRDDFHRWSNHDWSRHDHDGDRDHDGDHGHDYDHDHDHY